ncbi:MAG: FecR domain-containing protein [Gemmatimonadaceae bacterium]|nr:FecR domain-containing protein [Gemmatimonadaceae bacterium]
MPATFTPISNDVLDGVRKGDEKSFERLFRQHFDALIEEAKANFDDAAAAPKVVEISVLRAWEQRASFESSAALEAFLRKSVHDGALREKGRKAALHRFEAHEGVHVKKGHNGAPATADEVWQHVAAALHAPPPDASITSAAKAEMSRHNAAEHMAAVGKRRSPLVTLAYFGGAVFVVATLLWAIFRESPAQKVSRFLKHADSQEIISKFGQVGSMTLGDGTKAKIGADSKLLIPPGFNTEVRAVRVTGTASFEVASGQSLPFEVRVGDAAVIATGTAFVVNYDTASSSALVRVDEGTVDVRFGDKAKEVRSVGAGKAVTVSKTGEITDASQAQVDETTAWTSGRLVVVDKTLRQALEQTRRWYGIALVPSDQSLMERKVSIDASLDSSKDMIADLEQSGNMQFGWDDKTMTLYDKGTVKAKK